MSEQRCVKCGHRVTIDGCKCEFSEAAGSEGVPQPLGLFAVFYNGETRPVAGFVLEQDAQRYAKKYSGGASYEVRHVQVVEDVRTDSPSVDEAARPCSPCGDGDTSMKYHSHSTRSLDASGYVRGLEELARDVATMPMDALMDDAAPRSALMNVVSLLRHLQERSRALISQHQETK